MTKRLLARIKARVDALRASFFFIPALAVLTAVGASQGLILLDLALGENDFPVLLDATVSSARIVLSSIAGATITFAGIAFSISMLMLQLASGQFSPRVLFILFRDKVSKRVMAIAVGTFTYSLLILRAVQSPAEETASVVIPNISVLVAIALGVATILAIISFINHIAHSMQVGEIIHRIADDSVERIRSLCPDDAGSTHPPALSGEREAGSPLMVTMAAEGWVQQIELESLLEATAPGSTVRCEVAVGDFVMKEAPLCSIWPHPDDPDEVIETARAAIVTGRSRTMQEDIGFGIRQIVDIALRALSPGVNDPTTAREAIVYLGVILREILVRDLPPRVISDEDDRRLYMHQQPNVADYLGLAFNEIRRTISDEVAVRDELLATLVALVQICERKGLVERARLVRDHVSIVLDEIPSDAPAPSIDLAGARHVALELDLHQAEKRLAELG